MNTQFPAIITAALLTLSTTPVFAVNAADEPAAQLPIEMDGYTFDLWNSDISDAHQLKMEPQSNGCFSGIWKKGTDGWALTPVFIACEQMENALPCLVYGDIVRSYEADFETDGTASLEYYGCMDIGEQPQSLSVEYHIVEAWCGLNPVGDPDYQTKLGTICSDGKEYDLYQQVITPVSINGGPMQYVFWSICKESPAVVNETNHLSGTVSVSNHLKAWAALSAYEINYPFSSFGLSVTAYNSSGSAENLKNEKCTAPSELTLLSKGADNAEPTQEDSEKFQAPVKLLGDTNGDGKCSVADIILLQKWILNGTDEIMTNWKAADCDGNNLLDARDLTWLKRSLLK